MLRLIKIINGIRQVPKTFFDKLRAGILERRFIQSKPDPCIFMKYNMVCIVYLDDMIIAVPKNSPFKTKLKALVLALTITDTDLG